MPPMDKQNSKFSCRTNGPPERASPSPEIRSGRAPHLLHLNDCRHRIPRSEPQHLNVCAGEASVLMLDRAAASAESLPCPVLSAASGGYARRRAALGSYRCLRSCSASSSGVPLNAGPQLDGSRSTTIATASCAVSALPIFCVREGPST